MTKRILACVALVVCLAACDPKQRICVGPAPKYTPTQIVDLRLHTLQHLLQQHRITRAEYYNGKSELLGIRDALVKTGN